MRGQNVIAAAPFKITDYIPRSGKAGGVIIVSYGQQFTGYYAYASLLSGVKVGDFIPRGKAFGSVQDCDIGQAHFHFCLIKSVVVDPYDYWTVYKKPQNYR
jgi:hypothetical protein